MLMPGLMLVGSHALAGWRAGARLARRRRKPVAPRTTVALPAGLDYTHLLDAVREQFIRLQAAWDAADLGTLGALTTPQMLAELCAQIPPAGSPPNRTDVLSVKAELLGFDDLQSAWIATIEFSGLIRESPEREAAPFRELWLLMREHQPHAGGSDTCCTPWRLARQQALL
jgi:predicted lipid-binding transport protein (Tim44 family)